MKNIFLVTKKQEFEDQASNFKNITFSSFVFEYP